MSQIMTLSRELKKKNDCLGHFSFTQLVNDVENLVCTTCGLNISKYPPEAAKVATSVNFFNVEKT